MKRPLMPAILLFAISLLFFGCSNEMMIEKTIDDWTGAINNNDVEAMEDVLSPDSDYYITLTANYLVGDPLDDPYFEDFTPVSYALGSIDIDVPYADVPATATYVGVPNNAMFVMKREPGFLSFLFPDWKVYRYFDNGDFTTAVWRKPKM